MSDDISADPRSASFLATNTKPNKEVPNDYYQHTNPETLYILPIKRAVILEFESDTGFETQYEISSQQKGFIYRAGAEYLQRSSEILTGWVSPRHEITLAKDSRKAAGIPRKAKYYSFLHPPKGLADYIEWAKVTNNDDYALSYIASFGAYVYFDKNSEIICVNVITMKKTEFKLKCEGPFIAANDAYEKIDALNRFQPLHIDAFREVGFVGSAWIEPNEDEYLDSCHTGLRCHHGAFLYFRRDKTAVVFLVLGLDEDTTTPKYQVGSLIVDAFRLCKHELERKHTLATTCAKSFTETVSRSMNFDETNNIVLRNASSLDAIDHVSSILPEVKDFDFGWSPLHYACCYFPRDLKLIKKVYQSNPDALYAKTVNDLYPIHLACQNAPSLDVIKVLTEHDEEKHTLHGQSKHHGLLPIHFACSNAMTNFDVIQHLINEDRKHRASKFNIKGYDIDKLSPRVSTLHHASILGWTALHRAVCCNHSYEVLREIILPSNTEYFVEKNYDLLGLEANRMLPIHIACLRGCSKSTIAFLLNADSTQGHLNFFRRVTCIEYNLEESTTLHIALAYAPTDAIDLVLNIVTKACIDKDEKKQLCDMTETHDYMLPIHVACARKSVSADVIKTLLRLNGEGIFQRDKNGNTPLHLLFQNEINDERKVQILLDTASSMETPSSRHFITKLTNNKQETPFMIALKNKIKGAYELMNPNYVCLKSMHDDEKLEMLELILKTKQFRNHLVKNLSQRMYFALIMFELIAIVVTTAMYINLSSSIVLDTGVYITMVEIIVLSIYATYALTREVMKLSGNEAWDYIADGWNWVECFSLGTLIAATVHMVHLKLDAEKGGTLEPEQYLFMATGILLFFSLIFSIRTTFLPFARFVAGLLGIITSLIPFAVITILVLLCFTYAFILSQSRPDQCSSFRECFLYTLEAFFFGMEDFSEKGSSPILDATFGILAVVMLLNVVIAIISNAWNDSVDSTRQVFWKSRMEILFQWRFLKRIASYRIGLLVQIDKVNLFNLSDEKTFLSFENDDVIANDKSDEDDESDDGENAVLRNSMMSSLKRGELLTLRRGSSRRFSSTKQLRLKPSVRKVVSPFKTLIIFVFRVSFHSIIFVAGLATLGVLWPKGFRTRILSTGMKLSDLKKDEEEATS